MKETVTLTFDRFRTSEGEPTCIVRVYEEYCIFFRTAYMGTVETCALVPSMMPLTRRGKDGLGYLIPGEWCPLWKEDKK